MEEQIRNRAYQLWQEAGSPEGDGVYFWLQAEFQILYQVSLLHQDYPLFDSPSFILLEREYPKIGVAEVLTAK